MGVRRREAEELRRQSKHVLYEIQMLGALAGYIRTGEVDDVVEDLTYQGVPARNAIVEAFELHARNLIEFLIHQRTGRRSTAREYAPTWRIPDDAAMLRTLRSEFSERVAHLSWTRSSREEKEQVVASEEIFDAIAAHLETFLEQADQDLLGDRFVEKARFALARPEEEWPDLRAGRRQTTAAATSPTPTPHTGGTATQAFGPMIADE